MKHLTSNDIVDIAQYERQRNELRDRVTTV
jgi:hypothetical protein